MPKSLTFTIDGQKTEDVYNNKEVNIDLSFSEDGVSETLSITDYEFVRKANDLILKKATDTSQQNTAFTEGVPFKVDVNDFNVNENIFDGYLDFTNQNSYGVERSTIKAVDKKNLDWLNNVADGFSFDYLLSIGLITDADKISVPYVINSIPDNKDAAIYLITTFTLTAQIADKILDIIALAIKMADGLETAVAIAEMIVYIAYLITFLIALVKTIQQLYNALIQPVKYHSGMMTKTLLERGCKYLGMNFSSTIFNSTVFKDDFYLPEKYQTNVNKNGVRGWLTSNTGASRFVPDMTFGDFLRLQKSKFNAHIKIENNTIYLLKKNENVTTGQKLTLPPLKRTEFKLNVDDFKACFFIKFQTDLSEANTIDNYKGTSVQIQLEPINVTNKDLRTIKGFDSIDLPVALARTKTKLTQPEEIFKEYLVIQDGLINTLITGINIGIAIRNAIVKIVSKILKALKAVGIKLNWKLSPIPKLTKLNSAVKIENRIGMLVLETDFFNVPKNFILIQGKINKPHADNNTIFSAKNLWDLFYILNSFLPSTGLPNGNQYFIYNFENVPMTIDDFKIVEKNNVIGSDSGDLIVKKLSYNYYNETCSLEAWENKAYTGNLKQTVIEPSGQ